MNVLNRILIVILLLLIMVSCSLLLIRPVPAFSWLADWSEYFAWRFGAAEPYSAAWIGQKALGLLFALALDIVLLFVIVLEVRRATPKAIRVETTSGGRVQVSVASIADRLRYEVDQLAGVLRVKANVSAKRGGVLIHMDVQTAAGIDVPERAERIVQTARLVVEEKMGLRLARPPEVNLRAVPYPRLPRMRKGSSESAPILPGTEASPALESAPADILLDEGFAQRSERGGAARLSGRESSAGTMLRDGAGRAP
jgi:hypothetical protein